MRLCSSKIGRAWMVMALVIGIFGKGSLSDRMEKR